MRRIKFFAVLALALASFVASAQGQASPERNLRLAAAQYEKGHSELALVPTIDSNSGRLRKLERAIFFLRSARSTITKNPPKVTTDLPRNVDVDLANALNDSGEIYYARKSLRQAEKRADEALLVIPGNARSTILLRKIEVAKETDIYDENLGTVAIRRIRDRRAAAGLPLRDRGASNRR